MKLYGPHLRGIIQDNLTLSPDFILYQFESIISNLGVQHKTQGQGEVKIKGDNKGITEESKTASAVQYSNLYISKVTARCFRTSTQQTLCELAERGTTLFSKSKFD